MVGVWQCRPRAMITARTSRGSSSLTSGCDPLDAGDLRQARHLEAMAIVIIGLMFSGYDPYSVFAFVSPSRTGQPFRSR